LPKIQLPVIGSTKLQDNKGLFIALLSVHGLIRGHDLELGRDADTGGQTKYVVELAKALGQRDDVRQVVLLTRKIVDSRVSEDYAEDVEALSDKVQIIRISCGEAGYIRKELLWDSLDAFCDNTLTYFEQATGLPDILHSHYADAGYVAARLSRQTGVPLVHTGHSLGRGKRKQLLASGVAPEEVERTYQISRRIDAEEDTLSVAVRVITSTRQEVDQQYAMYDFYQPERMRVVPPGTDLQAFHPPLPKAQRQPPAIAKELERFLREPCKPIILALARPDPKKNLVRLVQTYGESAALQAAANLVLIAGNRDDVADDPAVSGQVHGELLLAIDKYDLYGKVAYPKHHLPADVADMYRLAMGTGGVFINPALTEPFGLTLIEAAACGLPMVATNDGGPVEILANCCNGYLIDPLDSQDITDKLLLVLTDQQAWRRMSKKGIEGVRKHYSWEAHVARYLEVIRPLAEKTESVAKLTSDRKPSRFRQRALFTSLDLNLTGDAASLAVLIQRIQSERKSLLFGVATGRHLDDALGELRRHGIPEPDVLITHQGTQIHYAPGLNRDTAWEQHIDHHWNPAEVRSLLDGYPGLTLQSRQQQGRFKISYMVDPTVADIAAIRQTLMRGEQDVNAVFSFGQFLDVIPTRASKGLAVRWCAVRLGFQLERTLVAGVTAADADMLRGNTLGAVITSQHPAELAGLAGADNIYYSRSQFAQGILESMAHYGF